MELGFNQSISLALNMALSPRMVQMLKVLNLPYIELVEKIKEEAENNPLLEVEKADALIEYLRYSEKSPYREVFDESKEDRPEFETFLKKYTNMEDYLVDQITIESLEKKQLEIAKTLIRSIDDKGYILNYEDLRASIATDLKVKPADVDKALRAVQDLEPEGIGARNLKECLLIQVREYNFEDEKLQNIIEQAITDHLEDIGEKRFDLVAKALGLTADAVSEIANFIKQNLNPYPASIFERNASPAIPSFEVREAKGKLILTNLEETHGPQLMMNKKIS